MNNLQGNSVVDLALIGQLDHRNRLTHFMRMALEVICYRCWATQKPDFRHKTHACPVDYPDYREELEMMLEVIRVAKHHCFTCLMPTRHAELKRQHQHVWVEGGKCREAVKFGEIFVFLVLHPELEQTRDALMESGRIGTHALLSVKYLTEFLSEAQPGGSSNAGDLAALMWAVIPHPKYP